MEHRRQLWMTTLPTNLATILNS